MEARCRVGYSAEVPSADTTNIVLNEEVVNSLADAMTDDLGKLLTLFIEKLKD